MEEEVEEGEGDLEGEGPAPEGDLAGGLVTTHRGHAGPGNGEGLAEMGESPGERVPIHHPSAAAGSAAQPHRPHAPSAAPTTSSSMVNEPGDGDDDAGALAPQPPHLDDIPDMEEEGEEEAQGEVIQEEDPAAYHPDKILKTR